MARPAKAPEDRTVVATVRLTPHRKGLLQARGAGWLSDQLDLSEAPMARPLKLGQRLAKAFERQGPLLTAPEHGAEPSLSDIIALYYERSGIEGKKAAKLRDAYIKQWVRELDISPS